MTTPANLVQEVLARHNRMENHVTVRSYISAAHHLSQVHADRGELLAYARDLESKLAAETKRADEATAEAAVLLRDMRDFSRQRYLSDEWAARVSPLATALLSEHAALKVRVGELSAALTDRAYVQGQDSDGWFRECNICGEECRLPDRDKLVHSVTCPLRTQEQP